MPYCHLGLAYEEIYKGLCRMIWKYVYIKDNNESEESNLR